ncbi:hypothetical protein AeRB84_012435 [Aphanomyces euteiches]|nr:hypothetical protein AeRB84_012435 [Aphanomyces euteiches]
MPWQTFLCRVCVWLVLTSTEVFAYLVVPYLLYQDASVLVTNLQTLIVSRMAKYDAGPSMKVWEVSLYTGYNTTASQNEVLMRQLIDKIDGLPLGSRQSIDVPLEQIPFTLSLGKTTLFLQSVPKTNQKVDVVSGRYSLMVGKSFSMGYPIFDPLESLVMLIKIDNKVSGYKALRVLKAVNANDTHQALVDVTKLYSSLVGHVKHQMCVMYFDTGANKCGSVILPPAVAATLVADASKSSTVPSCEHPQIERMVYSILEIGKPTNYCASDPTAIADLLVFENWNVVSQIPSVTDQYIYTASNLAPTGFSLLATGTGFLDASPNATAVMLPLVLMTNRQPIGVLSRVDYIIQSQLGILVASRTASVLVYLALLIKFSWTKSSKLSPRSDSTAAMTLVLTYWKCRDMMLAVVVRQLLTPLPWNFASLHSYMDDLIFIPGPVCYIFIFGLCAMKHVLHSFRMCMRLAYAATYLATIILVTGALTNGGDAFTAVATVEPYSLQPTLVVPTVFYFYPTSPHLDSYFFMAYATFTAIILPPLILSLRDFYKTKLKSNVVASEIAKLKVASLHSSLDLVVGLAIRFPGDFVDRNRMSTRQDRYSKPRSTLYSLGLAGYVQMDGCLMQTTSVCRCFTAFLLGSIIDTAGPIHYFKLTRDQTAVETQSRRTFPTEFIRDRHFWKLVCSLSLCQLH